MQNPWRNIQATGRLSCLGEIAWTMVSWGCTFSSSFSWQIHQQVCFATGGHWLIAFLAPFSSDFRFDCESKTMFSFRLLFVGSWSWCLLFYLQSTTTPPTRATTNQQGQQRAATKSPTASGPLVFCIAGLLQDCYGFWRKTRSQVLIRGAAAGTTGGWDWFVQFNGGTH